MSANTKDARPISQQRSAEHYALRYLQRLMLVVLNHLSPASIPAIARGTTAQKVKTVGAVNYLTDGAPRAQKAATDDLWTLTGSALAVSSFRKYLLLLDSAGAASVLASTDAAAAADCKFSSFPDGKAIIGWVQVATSAAVTFTPGTTALNGAGITATFGDGIEPTLLKVLSANGTLLTQPDL